MAESNCEVDVGVRIKVEEDLFQYLNRSSSHSSYPLDQHTLAANAGGLFPMTRATESGFTVCTLGQIVAVDRPPSDVNIDDSNVLNAGEIAAIVESAPRPDESGGDDALECSDDIPTCPNPFILRPEDGTTPSGPSPLEEIGMVMEVYEEGQNTSELQWEKIIKPTPRCVVEKSTAKGTESGEVGTTDTSPPVADCIDDASASKMVQAGKKTKMLKSVGQENIQSQFSKEAVTKNKVKRGRPRKDQKGKAKNERSRESVETTLNQTGLRKRAVKENTVSVKERPCQGQKGKNIERGRENSETVKEKAEQKRAVKESAPKKRVVKETMVEVKQRPTRGQKVNDKVNVGNLNHNSRVKRGRVCKKTLHVNLLDLSLSEKSIVVSRTGSANVRPSRTNNESGCETRTRSSKRNTGLGEVTPDKRDTKRDGVDEIESKSKRNADKRFRGRNVKKQGKKAEADIKNKDVEKSLSNTENQSENKHKDTAKRLRQRVHTEKAGSIGTGVESTIVKQKPLEVKTKEASGTGDNKALEESNGLKEDENGVVTSNASKGKKLEHLKKKFSCPYCKKLFNKKVNMKAHKRTHTGEKPYVCKECSKAFTTWSALHVHKRTHLPEDQRRGYSCHICGKVFDFQYNLNRHLLIHTKEPQQEWIACEYCGEMFLNGIRLRKHWAESHGDQKPFKCPTCCEGYPTKNAMRLHVLQKHIEKKLYPCQYCKKVFYKKDVWRAHERIHTGEKPYVCEECGKAFPRYNSLKSHKETHMTGDQLGSFSCDICGIVFGLQSKLTRHLQIHKPNRVNPCEICGKVYATRAILSWHLKAHQNLRSYECPHCKATFVRSSRLSRHIKRGKPCKHCDFVNQCCGTAKEHLMTHTEYQSPKKHCCSQCNKGFDKQRDLLRHAVLHLDKSQYPFACSGCSERFNRKDRFKQHLKNVHRQADFAGQMPTKRTKEERLQLLNLVAEQKPVQKEEPLAERKPVKKEEPLAVRKPVKKEETEMEVDI